MILEADFDIRRISKVKQILRITAWDQRFVHDARNPSSKKPGLLCTEELQSAEEYWIKITQIKHFPEEH